MTTTTEGAKVMAYCEDYPCCGHTPQDPCERQPYDEPDYWDLRKNPHALCDHENGECEVDYEDDEDELDCGQTITLGMEDSATCDIPNSSRHSRHEGPTSLGGRASWEGGGYCAGDPLPVRNLTLIRDEY